MTGLHVGRLRVPLSASAGILVKHYFHTYTTLYKSSSIMSKLKVLAFGEGNDMANIADSLTDQTQQSRSLLEDLQISPTVQLPLSNVQERLNDLVREEAKEYLQQSSDSLEDFDVENLVVKFKVTRKCYEEFGVMIPNNKLSSMKSLQDLSNYYSSLQPKESTRSFKSVEAGLPPNLTMN